MRQGIAMDDVQAFKPEQVSGKPQPSRSADPLRRWTLVILVIGILLFGWTLIADRLTPYTSDASVRSLVVRMRPEVTGKIIEVGVPPFGPWNTVFKRYRDWVKADVFKRLFDAASDQPDMEYAMVDATIVKAHRHGQGAKGGLRARPSAAPRAA